MTCADARPLNDRSPIDPVRIVLLVVLLLNVFIAAIAVRDLRTRGRQHPVTLWGGGLLILSEPLRFIIAFSEPWQALARALMN